MSTAFGNNSNCLERITYPPHRRQYPQQIGTSLVEILVAISLCALTGMAVAKGLVLSLHRTMDHKLEVIARTLVSDFVERTYANRPAALAGHYVMTGAAAALTTNCFAHHCTPVELAAYDLGEWSRARGLTLPGSEANITLQNRTYTLTLTWHTRVTGPAATDCAIDVEPGQRCLQVAWEI